MMILWHIIALVLITVVAWWASGYDSRLSGEDRREDYIRRIVRCGMTLFFVEVMIWLPPAVIVFAVFLGVLWAGCLSEFLSQKFRLLIDPEDKRQLDPKQSVRQLDLIAELVRRGRKADAIQLCESLKLTGEVDLPTLEMTLEHLGVPQTTTKKSSSLTVAGQLRREGKFTEAQQLLNSLLAENPRNVDAAMMLVRLYAQDLREPHKAHDVLRVLEQQPHVPAGHIQFARRSIAEWSRPSPTPKEVSAQPESVEELLAAKCFGTAIEVLEQKIQAQPRDFDLWLKLAESHGRYCGDLKRAEKIIEQMKNSFAFSAEQIQAATSRLGEWRAAGK